MTTSWIVEPRDPIVARDGRPFVAAPGARAVSLPFPMPSTVAGAARSRAGGDPFDVALVPRLLDTGVRGPFLVVLDDAGEVQERYFAAPADMVASRGEAGPTRMSPLVPVQLRPGEATNLPAGLHPIAPTHPMKGKPPKGMPPYWTWVEMSAWLSRPAERALDEASEGSLGTQGPLVEERVHVAIVRGGRVALEGALFTTEGRRFERIATGEAGKRVVQRFAMLVVTDLALSQGLDTLGAEGRIVAWRSTSAALPACPPEVLDSVARTGACRLVLATPGLFAEPFRPALPEADGVRPVLVAAAVPSSQTLSGFDMAKGKPKRARRLSPAGSVYFVRLEGSEDARRAWVNARWLRSLSDGQDGQHARDGFGLTLVGAWDGTIGELRDAEEDEHQ